MTTPSNNFNTAILPFMSPTNAILKTEEVLAVESGGLVLRHLVVQVLAMMMYLSVHMCEHVLNLDSRTHWPVPRVVEMIGIQQKGVATRVFRLKLKNIPIVNL